MIDINELLAFSKTINISKPSIGKYLITKAVGITFDDRQDIIKLVSKDTPIILDREKTNEFDKYAVAIKASIFGVYMKVGFLSKDVNKNVALILDSGTKLKATIENTYSWQTEYGNENKGICLRIYKE
jgi:single-stranded-DNA-specific exonuclease